MAADQVQEKPKESDAKASDAAAAKPAETPKNEVKAAEQGANDKMQQEVSGATAQNKADAGTSTDSKATSDATADVRDEAAEAEVNKFQKDADLSDPKTLEDLRKLDHSQLTDAQRKALGLPPLSVVEKADSNFGLRGRNIDLDGRTSVKEGESRRTSDAVVKIDGVELARFDDADTLEGQLEADIKVTLPDNAVTKEIAGVGKYSVIEGTDGSKTEVIQAEDGSVLIRRGDEFIKMSTGYWGAVTEGADAKKSFEALSEKIDAQPESGGPVQPSAANANLSAGASEGIALPAMAMSEGADSTTNGVRDIAVDGKVSVAEGATRYTDDAILTHEGKQIIEFDDADILENQWEAKISVNLPDSAKSKTVEGAGKHSLLEGKDGVSTEVIQSESGQVFVRKGNEYIQMTTGFDGQVIEGAEAKKAFEAEAAKYDLGAKSYDFDMRLDTKGTVRGSDGSELVNISKDGKVTANIPEGSFTNQAGNSTYAMLKDGTEMITTDSGATTIRNTDGTFINVAANGEIVKGTDSQTWDSKVSQFKSGDSTVAAGNDAFVDNINYDEMLAEDFYDLGTWMPMETNSGGYCFLDGGLGDLDTADLLIGMGKYSAGGGDLSRLEPIDLGLGQAQSDLTYSKYFDYSFKGTEDLLRSQSEENKRFWNPEHVEGLKNKIGDNLSAFEIPGQGTAVERIDALIAKGIPGAEEKELSDGSKVQVDSAAGIKRIETADGRIMLEFDRKGDGKDPITVSREVGADGRTQEFWNLGKDANGKDQILRRSGRDTWMGHIDGFEVSRANGAEIIRDQDHDFDERRHAGERRAGKTRNGEFISDGQGTSVFFRNDGQPARVRIGDQRYTVNPETGKLLDAQGRVVESGGAVNYEVNANGETVINGSIVISADRRSAVFKDADGTEHKAGLGVSAVGTDVPAFTNPNFKQGETPPEFELDKETAGDGKPPTVGINAEGALTGPGGTFKLDPKTGETVFTDTDGNNVGTFNINTGIGQLGGFKFADGGVQDLASGLGFNSDGDVYDYNLGMSVYGDDIGWSEAYERALYGGMTFAEYKEAEARGNQEAAIASSSFGAALAISMSGRVDMGAINFARSQLSALQALPVLTNAVISAIGYGQSAVATGESVRHGTDEIQKVATGIKDSYIVAQVGKEIAGGNSVNIRSVVLKTLRRVNPEHEWVRNEFSPDYIKGLHGDRNSDIA